MGPEASGTVRPTRGRPPGHRALAVRVSEVPLDKLITTDGDIRRRRWRGPAMAGVAVALVVVAYATGLVGFVRDGDRFEEALHDAGVWGPILYVVLFTALVPVGVPGLVFVVPAILIWPEGAAVALVMAGGMTSSVMGILFARHLGRRVLERRMPARFRRWDERMARHGFWGVVVLRVFTYLAAPADWVVGLSNVPLRTAVAGTFVGLTIPTLFLVLVGENAAEVVADHPWVLTPGLVISLLLAVAVWRRRRRRLAPAEPARATRPHGA